MLLLHCFIGNTNVSQSRFFQMRKAIDLIIWVVLCVFAQLLG